MNIAVIGAGYVGFANALVLARHHHVTVVDIDETKVDRINRQESILPESEIHEYMADTQLSLEATTVLEDAVRGAEWTLIATPTDYDPNTNCFDTSSVEECIAATLTENPNTSIAIRSTVPVGFTENMRQRFGTDQILFVPEFLREGRALHDSLNPSRVIVGDSGPRGQALADILVQGCASPDVPVLLIGSREAEAVKLFANSYLALRVAYFNEIDTYAISQGLDARAIIAGIGLDPRIGDHYNNPSFGYGGYCLPKDTKQLLANYAGIPQDMITAVVRANETRQDFIASDILKRQPKVVGIHRLIMKAGSDNFRSSSVFGVIDRLQASGVEVIVYEPSVAKGRVVEYEMVGDLPEFKRRSDIIVTNRRSDELADVADKVYTRDLYGRD
ncbi:MAG: nucleotide sugar dehydrogenase [Propionibacteriaceae bacterium]|nr:nucleotide sugar dehydrogenase [Propionibacteriaceae bacterium]